MKKSGIRKKITVFMLAAVTVLASVPVFSAKAENLSVNVTCPFESYVQFEAGGSTVSSSSYRIPAMVTLDDGTMVAAADIRWNTTYDGGGLDTLTARSTDGGVSWTYTAANYLGDNGNAYNGSSSTAFIDPALVVAADGHTVYMLCDLYPYGIALNGSGNTAPSYETGFTDEGYLKLSNNNHRSYNYYLKDGQIYNSANKAVDGYTVDAYFNLLQNGEVVSNLFYADSPYKVVRTGYLYLTSSTDGGASWSEPALLNLKTSSEQVCLVGPGRGLTTAGGTMIFPIYSYSGSASGQRMGFIYSNDGGSSWQRIDSSVNWSSEAAVIELGSSNVLRFFYRNGTGRLCYVDYDMNSGSWGSAVYTDNYTNSNTQISAITYSKKSNGKQVVLVSCPAGSSGTGSSDSSASARTNGRIFVGTVESDNSISWANTIKVNNTNFMYSCLTERSDGSIAILYEDKESRWGAGDGYYYEMSMNAYQASDLGITFDGSVSKDDKDSGVVEPVEPVEPADPSESITDVKNIFVPVGKTATIEGLTGLINTEMLDTEIATVEPSSGTLDNNSITITGNTVADTAVVVGTVQFNIHVVNAASSTNKKYLYIYVKEMDHTTVYYTVNGTSPIHEVEGTGVLVDQTYNGGFHLMFFAAPDEGYALTDMLMEYNTTSPTGDMQEAKDYYSLGNGTRADGADSDAWPFTDPDASVIPSSSTASAWKSGHGFRWSLLQGNITIEGMRNAFTQAVANGCKGATNMTKNGTNDGGYFFFSFKSEKMPSLEKEIVSYERDGTTYPYADGTELEFGDKITYRFTITSYSTKVEYTNINLADNQIGLNPVAAIADNAFDTAGTYSYTGTYTINEADVDKYANGTFTNEAELSYEYSTEYQGGTMSHNVSAEVTCRINGMVHYRWQDGLPEGITADAVNYPLPAAKKVVYNTNFQVEEYAGKTVYYVVEDDVAIGKWTFKGWEYNGNTYQGGETQRMPGSGNVEFVGKWEYTPSDTTLTIKKSGASDADENQTFLFRVTGEGVDVTVTVHGNGSVDVAGLKMGSDYTITEIGDWSWRYTAKTWKYTTAGTIEGEGVGSNADITVGKKNNIIEFSNDRENEKWIDGGNYKVNIFNTNGN